MGLGCERLVEGSFDEVISAQFFPKMRRAYDRAFQLLLMLMASRFHEKLREAESQKASPLASSAQLEKKKKKERVLNKSKYKNGNYDGSPAVEHTIRFGFRRFGS